MSQKLIFSVIISSKIGVPWAQYGDQTTTVWYGRLIFSVIISSQIGVPWAQYGDQTTTVWYGR